MYRRVLIPMGIALGAVLGLALLAALCSLGQKAAIDRIYAGHPIPLMPPALPATGWLAFLGVFFAVRLCSLRGGTRRECLAVGLAPALLALIPSVAVVVTSGLSSLLVVLGLTAPILNGSIQLGEAIAARDTTALVLGQFAAGLSATWLWFFVSRQRAEMGTGSPV